MFSVKGQIVNRLGFAGHAFTTTQFYQCSLKSARGNMSMNSVVMFQENFIYEIRWWAGFGALGAIVCQFMVKIKNSVLNKFI